PPLGQAARKVRWHVHSWVARPALAGLLQRPVWYSFGYLSGSFLSPSWESAVFWPRRDRVAKFPALTCVALCRICQRCHWPWLVGIGGGAGWVSGPSRMVLRPSSKLLWGAAA